jgi:hypothetical protein
MSWPLAAFLLFTGLCALFIGWGLSAGQKALDRRFAADDKAMRDAMRSWPP